MILDRNNQPVRNEKINHVIWDTNKKGIAGLNLKWEPITDNDGKLTASLTSTEPVTNITVSLTIENQKAVEVKQAVSFEPEQLSPITVSPPSPILVNNTYTLKVKVKDTTGKNPEPNKKVNWTIKDPAQKGVTLTPTSGTTDASGDATTTLTSTQAQKVTVVASVEGIKTPQSVDVEFHWPTIQKIELTQKNGTVLPGGKYDLTATISGTSADSIDHYKGKFEWQLESPTNQGLALSPAGAVSVEPGGIVKAKLTSPAGNPPVTGAKVCLNVVGAPAVGKPLSPAQCIDPVNFASPPVEFDIVSVEVTNFDKDKPLQGDGLSAYRYKALIVKKGTTEPITHHTFSGVNWVHDHDKIAESKLPPPEAYSPTKDDKFKTDGAGYLYARLKSHVGVENVKVTLKIPEPDGTEVKRDVVDADKVEFSPVVQDGVLYVYNNNNKSVYKYFDNTNGQSHPHTVFETLRGELRASINSDSFSSDKDVAEIVYSLPPDSIKSPYGAMMLSFGDGNHGPIQFNAPGTAIINVTITKKSGEIQLHKYEITIIKLAAMDNNYGYVGVSYDVSCQDNIPNSVGYLYSDNEVYNPKEPSDPYSLHNEWGNIYKWGVFDNHPVSISNEEAFIVKDSDPNNNIRFRIYNAKNNTFEDQSEGLVLCYFANNEQ
ncbi:inverse autotransporter beta-barrel domain-containing protein [Xenorhabdus beddingii]|uniref:Inverse autotransporter beta-barrel domain-containing protein n=1 Tax=Xenorhabdus beddingii TaxID=40578 RepID=A0A1Y2SM61_9GAMM|nr:inverse autotransporter beta-barrel domain-containing protein [Xenorhabdus beddingii]